MYIFGNLAKLIKKFTPMETSSSHNEVTESILKMLKESDGKRIPWRKGWTENQETVMQSIERPFNPTTGTIYKGMNFINLSIKGFDIESDPRFMTYKQASQRGYTIKKGSKASSVWFMAPVVVKEKVELQIENQEAQKLEYENKYYTEKQYKVFHASQIEGLDKWIKPDPLSVSEDFSEIKALIENAPIDLKTSGVQAFYSPSRDQITMPPIHDFENEHRYYQVLLHEIGHWTGHESRIDRSDYLADGTREERYAAEELVAEMFSLFSSPHFRVAPHLENSAAYIQGWISVLENDPKFLYRATSAAERSVELCCDIAKIDMNMKVKVEQLIAPNEIEYPFYGKNEEELKPYIDDLLNGRTTEEVKGLSKNGGKPFDAKITLSKKPDGSIRVKFFFPKKKVKKKTPVKRKITTVKR